MGDLSQKADIEGIAVVTLGSFNPLIFQPLWFARHNLISETEAKNADIRIIHKEIVAFRTESFGLQVDDERCQFSTSDPAKFLPLRDLVQGTFSVLQHTPITAFGLNSDRHFRMDSAEVWHAFGDFYVPKNAWFELLEKPGMRSLVVEGKRPDSGASRIQLKIEPSLKLPNGVYISVNEHYDVPEEDRKTPGEAMMGLLRALSETWESFLLYRNRASAHLLNVFKTHQDEP